jgi:hypothetical protein
MNLASLSQLELCDLQGKRTLALELSHYPDNLPHLRVLGMIRAEFARRDAEITKRMAANPLKHTASWTTLTNNEQD